MLLRRELLPHRRLLTLLHRIEDRLRLVLRLDYLPRCDVRFRHIKALKDHRLYLLIRESVGRLHLHLRLFAAALLARAHLQNAVSVDEELHLNAWKSRDHRRNALEIKPRQRSAVLREFALALHDMDRDVRLPIDARSEVLRRARRNRRVALDNLSHYTAERFDPERQRSDIEQQQVVSRCAGFTGENLRLYRSTQRNDLIRIQLRVQLLAANLEIEEPGHERAHSRDACRSADHHDLVDLLR